MHRESTIGAPNSQLETLKPPLINAISSLFFLNYPASQPTNSFLLRLLIKHPRHPLPHLIATNHNRTRRRDLHRPGCPPPPQSRHALFSKNMHQEPRHTQLLRRQRAPGCAHTVFENLLPRLAYIEWHSQDRRHSTRDGAGGETVREGVGVVFAALTPAPLAAARAIAVEFPTSSALANVG